MLTATVSPRRYGFVSSRVCCGRGESVCNRRVGEREMGGKNPQDSTNTGLSGCFENPTDSEKNRLAKTDFMEGVK